MPGRLLSLRSRYLSPLLAPLLVLVLLSCSPTFNWREVVPPGGRLKAMFPCKPSQERRQVTLVQRRVDMTMLACETGGAMFALGTADLVDPAAVGPALQALQQAAVANVAGQATATALPLRGVTPQPQAGAWQVAGRFPDGRTLQERLMVFALGTRVYQVTVFAERLPAEAVEGFVGGLTVR